MLLRSLSQNATIISKYMGLIYFSWRKTQVGEKLILVGEKLKLVIILKLVKNSYANHIKLPVVYEQR